MSKKCTSCQKKFFLNLMKIKCMECDQGFCQQCIRKGIGIKFYCKTCLILNTRPVDRSIIKEIRSKDVKLYLERRNVKTDRCLEKEDLVNVFVLYVSKKEPTTSNSRNKMKNNVLNGLISVFTNSMPNLSEPNISRSENPNDQSNQYARNPHEQPSSSQQVPTRPTAPYSNSSSPTENVPHPQNVPYSQNVPHPPSSAPPPPSSPPFQNVPPQNFQPPSPQNNPENYSGASAVNNTSSTSTSENTGPKPPIRKLIKLSDIENVEDIPNLSVKQLKELLFINRIDFKGCVEKDELVKKAINLWIENKSEDEPANMAGEDLCKICMDAPLNSVLLECGHIATCIDCGKQLAECPICRQYIVRVVHTFKA